MSLLIETIEKEPESRQTPGEDTTARGRIGEVLNLAYPVILTQLSMTTMGVVDSAMVGQLGATELAAVGFGGVWLWTLFCFFMGTANGVQTFVAQYHGADRARECGGWTWQGLYAVLPGVTLMSVALVGLAPTLLSWLAPSPEVQPLATAYISIRAVGAVGMVAATTVAAFVRGVGDTRTPLWATLFVNVVNAAADYALIFGAFGLPKLGVVGAAIATASAEWLYLVILGALVLRGRWVAEFDTRAASPDLAKIRRLLRTGLPIGGQWLLEMLSFAVFLTLVARMGDAQMAASQAFIALLSLSFMQATGLGIAASTLVGRYIGARDQAAVIRSYRSGLVLTLGLSGIIAVLFVAAPGPLIRMFSSEPAVLRLGASLLGMGALFQFFDAFGIMTDGALRGAGDTRWPFLVRFLLAWGVFLPSAWLFGIYLEGGLLGAWLGGLVYVVVLSSSLVYRFWSGAWRSIEI